MPRYYLYKNVLLIFFDVIMPRYYLYKNVVVIFFAGRVPRYYLYKNVLVIFFAGRVPRYSRPVSEHSVVPQPDERGAVVASPIEVLLK